LLPQALHVLLPPTGQYLSSSISISTSVIDLPEELKTGLDTLMSAAVLTWNFLGSLADIAVDVVSGRQLPEPDLKSVAAAPEPGATCKVRAPMAIPRTTRSKRRQDEAA
jgi:hypothetical protein